LIVIDASALIEILLQTNRAEALMKRVLGPSERLHAPHLLDIEIAQVLRRMAQRADITVQRAEEALDDYAHLLIERHSHQPLVERIWRLRDSLTAYDGAYVALAEALGAPLVTCDAKLARAHGHDATIVLVDS
jgi:predicted nucleic acid-binding protein